MCGALFFGFWFASGFFRGQPGSVTVGAEPGVHVELETDWRAVQFSEGTYVSGGV